MIKTQVVVKKLHLTVYSLGSYRMLRLQAEGDTEELPRLHDPLHPFTANTLHSLGEKLSVHRDIRCQ